MQFDSFSFFIFFVVVLCAYQVLPNWRAQKWLLLIASYLFYGAWSPPFIILLFLSTFIDYLVALQMEKAVQPQARKLWLGVSLASNLGMLGYFKYAQFLLESTESLLGYIGVHYAAPDLGIILPIGISFYIFQTLSYTLDVYRKKMPASRSLLDFALFVSFFPQLVAGPIVRAIDFLPQCLERKKVESTALIVGVMLIVWGLFQKTVLADGIFAPIVDEMYAGYIKESLAHNLLGIFSFSMQIYCDFAGYSLCAVGAAMAFGFILPDNFNAPYAARGFSGFWQRWHISLSQWLRDYIYISFGGNRRGQWITFRNLVITMFLGGLWHGANWNFVIWGLLHGFFLVLEHFYRLRIGKSLGIFTIPATFLITTLLWIPFRSPDLATTKQISYALVDRDLPWFTQFSDNQYMAFAGIILLFAYQVWRRHLPLQILVNKVHPGIQAGLLSMAIVMIALFSSGDNHAFIYFQF